MYTIIVFCGDDGPKAKARAAELRNDQCRVSIIAADIFDGEPMPADRVIVMADVPGWRRTAIVATFGERVEFEKGPEEPVPEPIPPAPPWEGELTYTKQTPKPEGFSEVDPASLPREVQLIEPAPVKRRRGRPRKSDISIGT